MTTIPTSELAVAMLLGSVRKDAEHHARLERTIHAVAVAGLLIAGVRGAIELLVPLAPADPSTLAYGLLATILLSFGLLGWSMRLRRDLERIQRNVVVLEIARDALAHEPAPVIEVHPYRSARAARRLVVHADLDG